MDNILLDKNKTKGLNLKMELLFMLLQCACVCQTVSVISPEYFKISHKSSLAGFIIFINNKTRLGNQP